MFRADGEGRDVAEWAIPSMIMTWLAFAAILGVLAYAAWRSQIFVRVGARVAGDHSREARATKRVASPDGMLRVAELATALAGDDEARLIRWTKARSATGARVVLGVTPAAWYLFLPEPDVMLRVPDALIATTEQARLDEGVLVIHCATRPAGDECVTATDGDVIEEAEDSATLAAQLLDGLRVADPNANEAPAAGRERSRSARPVAVGLAS